MKWFLMVLSQTLLLKTFQSGNGSRVSRRQIIIHLNGPSRSMRLRMASVSAWRRLIVFFPGCRSDRLVPRPRNMLEILFRGRFLSKRGRRLPLRNRWVPFSSRLISPRFRVRGRRRTLVVTVLVKRRVMLKKLRRLLRWRLELRKQNLTFLAPVFAFRVSRGLFLLVRRPSVLFR